MQWPMLGLVKRLSYHFSFQVLFVGGAELVDNSGEASASRCDGLTAWRVLSDTPHYKLLTDVDDQSVVSYSLISRASY